MKGPLLTNSYSNGELSIVRAQGRQKQQNNPKTGHAKEKRNSAKCNDQPRFRNEREKGLERIGEKGFKKETTPFGRISTYISLFVKQEQQAGRQMANGAIL